MRCASQRVITVSPFIDDEDLDWVNTCSVPWTHKPQNSDCPWIDQVLAKEFAGSKEHLGTFGIAIYRYAIEHSRGERKLVY